MNTEQIKTFLTLAETKNFSRAADALIISQSTVSKRVHELEVETGQPLFTRGQGGVKLTEAGAVFLKYAEQMIDLQETALQRIQYTSQYDDYLTLGTVYAYYDMYLWKYVKDFSECHKRISVRLKHGHSGAIINELRRSMIDIAFTHVPFNDTDYICTCIGADAIVLVTNHQNSRYDGGIQYHQIKELPLIDSNFLYMPTYRSLFPYPHQFQLKMDVASCTLPLLYGSRWYAFLPEKLVAPQLSAGTLKRIQISGGDIPPVRHYVIYKKENEQKPIINHFLQLLKA